MQNRINVKPRSSAVVWFILAAVFCALFLIYTAIYATHALDLSTLYVERWLLNRPIGNVDCLFYEWRNLGEVPFALAFTIILGLICWRAGFRPRVIIILFLLLGVCVGVEVIGKKMFDLQLPPNMRSGMVGLTCPQLGGPSTTTQLEAAVGLHIPPAPHQMVAWTHTVATMPIAFRPDFHDSENSYPGGHAMRWCFLGLIASWLCWRRIKRRVLRAVLGSLFFLLAFFGGFMQFYIGVHFLTDTISGYLLGIAVASCFIGFLVLNDLWKERIPQRGQPQRVYGQWDIGLQPTLPEHSAPGRPRGL